MNIDEAKIELEPYLKAHKTSIVTAVEGGGDQLVVRLPWNDTSIAIFIPADAEALVAALNSLLLPERFTAVWHRDTKDFEVIYTAFRLRGSQTDMHGRSFIFTYKGREYTCEFGRSSERLLTIAEHVKPIGPSNTYHRNLQSYSSYVAARKAGEPDVEGGMIPVSFWIRNFEWDDESAVEISRHLNFYMSYYDVEMPRILIHPPKQERESQKPRERYITGSFPKTIVAADLNSNLLHFWMASRGGDMFRRFLYCFQILEFASFYFIEDNIRRAVKRALSRPNIKDDVDSVLVEVIEHFKESKIWDGGKMDQLLRDVVDPKLLWREIEKNRDYFLKQTDFDGGFSLKPLIVEKSRNKPLC